MKNSLSYFLKVLLPFYFLVSTFFLISCSKQDADISSKDVTIDYTSDTTFLKDVLNLYKQNPNYQVQTDFNFKSSNTDSTQTIYLQKGYNMISSYLIPDSLDVEYLFKDVPFSVMFAENVVWVKGHFNSIGNWSYRTSYKIKMNQPYILTIKGNSIILPDSINFHSGINYLPVLSKNPINVDSLLYPHMDKIVMVVNMEDFGLYMPELNINTINYFQPGEGYMMWLKQPITLKYLN